MCVSAQDRGGSFAIGSLVILEPCSSAYKWSKKGGDTAVQMYGLKTANYCIGWSSAPNGADRLVTKSCDHSDNVMWNVLPEITAPPPPSGHWRNKEATACAKNIGTATNSQLELHSCDKFAGDFAFSPNEGLIKITSVPGKCVTVRRNGAGQFAAGSLVVIGSCSGAEKMSTKGGDSAQQMYGLKYGSLCIGHHVAPNNADRLILQPCDYKDQVMWNVLSTV